MKGPTADDVRHACSLLPLVPTDPKPRKIGQQQWLCRCPFHGDRTPSMSVMFGRRGWLWNCFGCGERGDVIDYVMRTEGCTFLEAMTKLVGGKALPPVPMWAPPRNPEVTFPCDTKGCTSALTVPLVEVPVVDISRPSWCWDRIGPYKLRGLCPKCSLARAQRQRREGRAA